LFLSEHRFDSPQPGPQFSLKKQAKEKESIRSLCWPGLTARQDDRIENDKIIRDNMAS
jgi:hypothetical protein